MKLKKLLMLLFAFALMVSFVACSKEEEKEPSVEEQLQSILNGIIVDSSIKKLGDDLVLPLSANGEYVINWSIDEKYSSNARIEYTDDGRQKISITKPLATEGWFEFELTATINKGLAKASRTWTSCYVQPQLPAIVVNCDELFDAAEGERVEVTGLVTYVSGTHGFWIEDEFGKAYIFINKEHEIKTGYTVKVTGEKDLYYSLLEIKNVYVQILEKGSYNYLDNVIDSSVEKIADSVAPGEPYDKEDLKVLGDFYKVSGRVIDDPNGKYTYAISDDLTGKSIVVYDSALEEAVLNKVGSLKGKYIECVVLFYDFYSTGFARVVPILETIKEAAAPVITDDVKIANTKAALEELLSSKIDQDVNLYTSNNYEGVSISWTSSNETVLDNAGKIGSSNKTEEKVTLTAVIKAGEKEETVEFEVTVVFVNESTVLEVLKACDEGEQTVVFTGKVVALDNNGYFYVADNTGVIYVRTALAGANVGDSVNVTGTAKVYKGYDKQYTRQVEASSVTKVEKEIEVVAPQKVNLTDFPAVNVNGDGTLTSEAITMIKETSLYGGLLEITGYLIGVADGDYTDHYISSENSEAGDKIYVYHGNDLTEVSKFEGTGKLVTIVCPVYDVQGADGFRLGTPISITEVK